MMPSAKCSTATEVFSHLFQRTNNQRKQLSQE